MDNLEVLIAERLTIPQIAQRMGKSESTVNRALKKQGLKTERHAGHEPNATTRACRYCDEEKPIEQFPVAAIKDGEIYRRHKCNTCYKDTKQARKEKMREWFTEYKKTLKCNRCPNLDFRVFEFHHKNDDKELNVSEAVDRWSKERIMKEVAKCEVICANCHRILHYNERHKQGIG